MSFVDPHDAHPALESLLRWYLDMGVDAAVGDVAQDRFAASAAPAAPPTGHQPQPVEAGVRAQVLDAKRPEAKRADAGDLDAADLRNAPPVSADALVRLADDLAAGADTLDELRARWEAVPGCGLATAARMIFASGTVGADAMLIGATPEDDDERSGDAFAGAHGRLLDAMLAAIGMDRTRCDLAHIVPWRPPGGRPATPLEVSLCLPFARRRIALIRPRLILCLGERAAQPLLATRDTLSRLRGRWLAYEGDGTTVKTLVTFSPDYLLKQPLQKRRAWADLQMFASALPGRSMSGPSGI